MQTSYQDYSIMSKSRPVVLNSPSTNDVRNTYLQPNLSSEVGKLDKTFGENYNFKRVYSPYLSPSHAVVEHMTTTSLEPNILMFLGLQRPQSTIKLIFTPDPLYQKG